MAPGVFWPDGGSVEALVLSRKSRFRDGSVDSLDGCDMGRSLWQAACVGGDVVLLVTAAPCPSRGCGILPQIDGWKPPPWRLLHCGVSGPRIRAARATPFRGRNHYNGVGAAASRAQRVAGATCRRSAAGSRRPQIGGWKPPPRRLLSMPTLHIARPVDPRFILDPFEPAYFSLTANEIRKRVEAGRHRTADCCACPRNCHVNRLANETKICNTGRYARVASALPHLGEEDCLRGWNGSGTIFFSLCNLRCVFCQNWDISQRSVGNELRPHDRRDHAGPAAAGCHNINFVTPEHVVPQVLEAIAVAIPRGLRLPIVYNTSGYDSVESLRLLDGIVDIYMPDFKFWKRETAKSLAKAPDYPEPPARRFRNAPASRAAQVRPEWPGPPRRSRPPSCHAGAARRIDGHLPLAVGRGLGRHVRQHHGPVPAPV